MGIGKQDNNFVLDASTDKIKIFRQNLHDIEYVSWHSIKHIAQALLVTKSINLHRCNSDIYFVNNTKVMYASTQKKIVSYLHIIFQRKQICKCLF